jgi:hypothetical protein
VGYSERVYKSAIRIQLQRLASKHNDNDPVIGAEWMIATGI